VGALLLSVAGVISIAEVGAVPSGVPPLRLDLPWATSLGCCSRARSSRASASPRRPPAPSLTTVIGRRSPLTPTAPATSPRPEPHLGHQQLLILVELDVLDNRLLDAQQGAP